MGCPQAGWMVAVNVGREYPASRQPEWRADLAGDNLCKVQAPTLLIVGGADTEVLRLNEMARDQMTCVAEIAVVDRATHLFEEPGALEQVQRLASAWFLQSLSAEAN